MARCAWSRWTRWSRCACIWWTRCVRSRWDGCAAWTSASSWPWPTASCTDTNLWRETDNHMMQTHIFVAIIQNCDLFLTMAFAHASSFRSTMKADTTHPKVSFYNMMRHLPCDLTSGCNPFCTFPQSSDFCLHDNLHGLDHFCLSRISSNWTLYSWSVLSNFVRKNWDTIPRQHGGYLEFIPELYLSQADPPRLNMCIVSNFMHLAASTDSSFRGQWYHLIVTRN